MVIDSRRLHDAVVSRSYRALFTLFRSAQSKGWTSDTPGGEAHWHAMVKLHVSEEATWVHDFVDDSLDRFRRKAAQVLAERESNWGVEGGSEGTSRGSELAATQFMCGHVRRQDFKASCARYEEEYRSGR